MAALAGHLVVASPEVVARHLARLRRDLNNQYLPPAVRAERLRQYRGYFYELAAAYFSRLLQESHNS